jgi:hypothetical protein
MELMKLPIRCSSAAPLLLFVASAERGSTAAAGGAQVGAADS